MMNGKKIDGIIMTITGNKAQSLPGMQILAGAGFIPENMQGISLCLCRVFLS